VTYLPPFILRNGHIQSIYPSLFRKTRSIEFERERITTPDNDFLDLDWLKQGNKRIVILSHGLEGNSRRPYIVGMADYASEHNWDALAWNYRGCSGTPNKHAHSYHSGKTEDFALIIEHALKHQYEEIALIGFSIGGNKTLLHLGRNHEHISERVIAAAALSVPCDLKSSSAHLAQLSHKVYMKNFLNSFKQKLKEKEQLFPEIINTNDFQKLKNFKDFDGRYTAPLNGFKSAEEYWETSSSLFYLDKIKVPSLILSALDDPFLPDECYPIEQASKNNYITLEMPKYGGHVGFMPEKPSSTYYSERRVIEFINGFSQIKDKY
tara:strand:+ start:63485 stop:64450 length:966 start_codon:yes stop_codon:yes gene_type:complete